MSNDKDFKVKNSIKPTVYHEAVGTVVSGSVGYSLSNAVYDNISASISQGGAQYGIAYKLDGTHFYFVDNPTSTVYQYNLSTGWDVSTMTYASKSFSVSSQDTSATGLEISSDGTKLYIVGITNNTIYQYNLSTAYDISTASYASKSFSVSSQTNNPRDIVFKTDGTKVYLCSTSPSDAVYQYSLSTAWDISTASYDSVSFSVSSQTTGPNGMSISQDGKYLLITGNASSNIYQYVLSTAWDLSTTSYDTSLDVDGVDTGELSAWYNDTGTKMYYSGYTADKVYQYSTVLNTKTLNLSTGSVFELTPTSDITVSLSNPAASGTVSGATLLLDQTGYGGYDIANAVNPSISLASANDPTGIVFNSDGTKMFVGQFDIDSVVEYTLSTAWDITTASITHTFSILAQDTWIGGLAFKTDGTSMYITGRSADNIYQYTLSTAWDLSTATYASKTLYLGTQGGQPYGLAFSADGTRVSVQNDTNTIYEYTLSTAWDVSTGSYASASFSFASQSAAARSFAWNADGTKMFLNSYGNDTVYQYSLSTAYRPSTASYDGVSYAYGALTTSTGIAFGDNGSKMYLNNYSPDSIHQYTTKTPATITYDTSIQWAGGTAPTSPAVGDTDVITFTTRDGGTTYNAALAIDGAS